MNIKIADLNIYNIEKDVYEEIFSTQLSILLLESIVKNNVFLTDSKIFIHMP